MEVIGKDCREIGEVLHTSLSKAERRAISAAQQRASEIGDLLLRYHFHGVYWLDDAFGYLHRVAGEGWKTWHYYGQNWDGGKGEADGPGFRHWRKDIADELPRFILHAERKQPLVNGRRPWVWRGFPVVGFGFPIHGNNKPRRVLSVDVDYPEIKALRNGWPPKMPAPDWRDPLSKPNLLLVDKAFGRDVEGRAQDAELLRDLGALVVPGETGFQAHFYLTDAHEQEQLRPVVEAVALLLHGKIDITNVGSYEGNGEWQGGLPSSLPLPLDRRHLQAFVIDPLIDGFFQGRFEVALDDLVKQVDAGLHEVGRPSPPSSTGGGSTAAPLAPPGAAPTIKGFDGRPSDPDAVPRGGEQDLWNKDSSGSNGIHTPDQAESEAYAEAANSSIRQSMSKEFLARLDAIQAGTGTPHTFTRNRATSPSGFPYSLLDERGLIWSHIPSIDALLVVPPDVPLGIVREGETNVWLNLGLAHFHSRDEFSCAIAGQGDEQAKLARYDWTASHGVQAVHQAAILPEIDGRFFEQVWSAVLDHDPIKEDDNETNVARAVENRRKRFVIACHGLVSSRCSFDGIVVLPAKGSASLLVGGGVNTTAFGRDVLGPVKQSFFDDVTRAWIKGWKRQRDRIPVLLPNAVGQALCNLLPSPAQFAYLEYDPCDLKRAAYFYDHSYREAMAAQQSHDALAPWRRATASRGSTG